MKSPNVTDAKNSTQGIKVYWEKVVGAKKYRVYRKENGSAWVRLGDVSADTFNFTDKNVKFGSKYDYTVKAVSGKNLSAYTKIEKAC